MRALDSSNQLDDVLALPDHLSRCALAVRVGRPRAPRAPGPDRLRHGRLGDRRRARPRGASGDVLNRPMQIFRDYELPGWTNPNIAVLCSSYSGNTEETLACFEAAEAVGAERYVATTGGRLAESARAAGVPVIGLPGGPAAAPRGRLRVHRRLRDRGAGRRRPGSADRDRFDGRPSRRRAATASSLAPPRSPSRSPARCR